MGDNTSAITNNLNNVNNNNNVPTPTSHTLTQMEKSKLASDALERLNLLLRMKDVRSETINLEQKIEINEESNVVRFNLSKSSFIEQLFKETGAICKLRGQFIAPTESTDGKTPLHLILTCDNEPGMRRALEMINEVKNRDKPPELIHNLDGQKLDIIQIGEEVDIDMHGIDKNFNLLEKLKGKDSTYITHIEKKITFQLKLED